MTTYAPTPPPRPPVVPPREWRCHWHSYPGGALALPPDVARRWRDAGRPVVFACYRDSVQSRQEPVARGEQLFLFAKSA